MATAGKHEVGLVRGGSLEGSTVEGGRVVDGVHE